MVRRGRNFAGPRVPHREVTSGGGSGVRWSFPSASGNFAVAGVPRREYNERWGVPVAGVPRRECASGGGSRVRWFFPSALCLAARAIHPPPNLLACFRYEASSSYSPFVPP